MKCKKCGSEDLNIQMVTEVSRKKKGWKYWLLFGWLIDIVMWIFLTVPWLIIKIFKPKKYKSKVTKQAVCQSCGYAWQVK